MNTHTLAEKLESTDCKRDTKARRVLNCAPDTVANITAEELEKGVSLERIEAINTPILLYSGQATIHGKIADFNEAARPGGYRAIFRNGNGSVGVRYAAIDADKKRTLARCASVSQSGWHTSANSSGFDVCRYFIVRDESTRADQKAATLAALKSFPVSRFYGSCNAFCLAYGMGYAVSANIGAIPVADLWPLCAEVFSVESLAELERREAIAKAAQDEKDRQWRAECAQRETANAAKIAELNARFAAWLPSVSGVKLASVPQSAGTSFLRYGPGFTDEAGAFTAREYRIAKRGSRLCYAYGKPGATFHKWEAISPIKWARWQESAKAGRVFAVESVKPVARVESAKVASEAAPSVAKDENAPASPRQTFALFCSTGKDWRATPGLTYGKAHAALSAVQHLRGNKPAALAIVSPMLEGATVHA